LVLYQNTGYGIAETQVSPIISIGAFKDIAADKRIELVDVRSDEERSQFNIGGKHIPVALLEERMEEIDANRKIIFYCASGKRSAEAVKKLMKHNNRVEAYSLEGGIKAWQEMEFGK
jgi:adenylyltransferase/sulfurtransferase